jgi:hypothetical protein
LRNFFSILHNQLLLKMLMYCRSFLVFWETRFTVEGAVPLLRILEVPGSNLDEDSGHTNGYSRGFPSRSR